MVLTTLRKGSFAARLPISLPPMADEVTERSSSLYSGIAGNDLGKRAKPQPFRSVVNAQTL